MPDPVLGLAALLLADHGDREAAEAGEAADDRLIVAEAAVACQRHETFEQPFRIVLEVRPVGVAGDLRLLPRAELAISLGQQLGGPTLKLGDLLGKVELAAVRQMAQLLHLAFKLGDRLLELEERVHAHPQPVPGTAPDVGPVSGTVNLTASRRAACHAATCSGEPRALRRGLPTVVAGSQRQPPAALAA